jgi:hypothetical protein
VTRAGGLSYTRAPVYGPAMPIVAPRTARHLPVAGRGRFQRRRTVNFGNFRARITQAEQTA